MDDLSHLFGAYFYEAWDEYEYQTWQHAVDDFARRSPGLVAGATSALQDLLAEPLVEDELDARLREQGCTYAPEQGARDWLHELLVRLRSLAAGNPPAGRTEHVRRSAMEAVKYLMGAYFHQDWVMDGGRSSDTVASFLHERRDVVVATADQIGELLEEDLPEGALAAQLEEWGCDYYAGDTDDAYRTWLGDIRTQMQASLAS